MKLSQKINFIVAEICFIWGEKFHCAGE